ncbi:DoxX family membrane protein [Actinopolymorpha alba]|uniref:DoxX family membrane protein n=1 Tax=Actinopolymorpha alba TaxID=533267 RepID=UPI00037AF1C9|nr:DoxX family membrane protein [Actinopolymorpha alba]
MRSTPFIPAQRSAPPDPAYLERRVRAESGATRVGPGTARWLAALRVACGLVLVWAFLDKAFGWGHPAPAGQAVAVGGWADWLVLVGLGGVGLALLLGVGLRVSAVAGAILAVATWSTAWPLAQDSSPGVTGSVIPIVSGQLLFVAVLIVLAATHAGGTWGFGRTWARVPFVRRHRWLL